MNEMRKLIESIEKIEEDFGVDAIKVSNSLGNRLIKITNAEAAKTPKEKQAVIGNVAEILAYAIDKFEQAGYDRAKILEELSKYK